MSTAFGIAIVMLVIAWYAPRLGWVLAVMVAFLACSALLADLVSCLDPPVIRRRAFRIHTKFVWGLVGVGLSAAMWLVARVASRRRAHEGIARAVARR
ncbi:MAG: hypothetical protein KF773_35300 [Deltaproteobacteria bacterium]|nr:hypothetical protein [Deltaproteobacteria bacterium]MCW5805332.1 hypothetical protein [Deltaproteobacteria bacterium]